MASSKQKMRYWEREQAKVITLGRNVLKLFAENGKIQVFPKVESAKNGVGRGSTIDLEHMTEKEKHQLLQVIQYAINTYQNKVT